MVRGAGAGWRERFVYGSCVAAALALFGASGGYFARARAYQSVGGKQGVRGGAREGVGLSSLCRGEGRGGWGSTRCTGLGRWFGERSSGGLFSQGGLVWEGGGGVGWRERPGEEEVCWWEGGKGKGKRWKGEGEGDGGRVGLV